VADESASASSRLVRFGGFELDVRSGELVGNGQRQILPDQPLKILAHLIQHPGEVVLREELRQQLWSSDTFVDFEHGLNAAVKRLRGALGDSADAPRYIETVPRRGYRLIASVVDATSPTPRAAVAADTAAPAAPTANSRFATGIPDAAANTRTRGSRRRAPLVVAALMTVVASSLSALWVMQNLRGREPAASGGPTPRIRSIAVLPFEDLSTGQTDVRYADGLTEALITELSTLDGFEKVIGRQSVARFRTSPVAVRDAARALGVDAIVTAAILRSAGRLRVTARLVDGVTERHLWAATYERSDGEVLLIQRHIVQAIVGAVHLALDPDAIARMPKAPPVDVAAFDAYIAGREALNDGPLGVVRAVAHFETATALAPEFAPAHAALAYALWQGSMFAIPASDAYRKGRAAAARAIDLDPNLGEAHAASGLLAFHDELDWAAADSATRRALASSPNKLNVSFARVHYLVLAARYHEAIDEARRGVQLDPSGYLANGVLAWAYLHARRYDDSLRHWRQADALRRLPYAHEMYALTLGLAGRGDDLRSHCRTYGTDPLTWCCAQGYALLGNSDPARAALESAPANVPLLALAETRAALADVEGTLSALQRAYDTGDMAALFMNGPMFDRVRHDPRFLGLQRRLNYPTLATGRAHDTGSGQSSPQ